MTQQSSRAGTFSGQVLVLFGTQVFGAGLGIVNGILLARLLGPALKGDYTFVILLPASAIVLVQLGLPSAFGYFSARGRTRGMFQASILLAIVLSVLSIGGILALMPVLFGALPGDITAVHLVLAFIALPFALHVTFTTGIVMGRQAVRWYAGVNIVYPIATTVLLIAVLGGFGASVVGALVVYLASTAIQSIGFAIGAARVTRATAADEGVGFRELFRYGLTSYPASLAGFFSYRVDVYMIAFLVADASPAIGYYSLAVGLAEMIFFFPRAVSMMFFPHVAGAPRAESDNQVAMVSRVTLLVSSGVALMLIPAAALLIAVFLPAFGPSFPPLLVLLPAVVMLSIANVIGGYVTGIGKPGILSWINVVAFIANIVANLVLIPALGIVGASAASLVSYSLSAVLLSAIAARFSQRSIADFWVIRWSDVVYLATTAAVLVRRLRGSSVDA